MKRLIFAFCFLLLLSLAACGSAGDETAAQGQAADGQSSGSASEPSFEDFDVLTFSFDQSREEYGFLKTRITVKNNSGSALKNVSLNVDILDADGNTIETDRRNVDSAVLPGKSTVVDTYLDESVVDPDEVSGFAVYSYGYDLPVSVYGEDGHSVEVNTVTRKLNWYEMSGGYPQGLPSLEEMNVLSFSFGETRTEYDFLITRITVTNNSKEPLEGVSLTIDLLDREGNTIATDARDVDSVILPGKSTIVESYADTADVNAEDIAGLAVYKYSYDLPASLATDQKNGVTVNTATETLSWWRTSSEAELYGELNAQDNSVIQIEADE